MPTGLLDRIRKNRMNPLFGFVSTIRFYFGVMSI